VADGYEELQAYREKCKRKIKEMLEKKTTATTGIRLSNTLRQV
jgi:hypothetical protein